MIKTLFTCPKSVGADIEFAISDLALSSLKQAINKNGDDELEEEFGIDGAGDIPEIRIAPDYTADKLTQNVKQCLENGLKKYPFLSRSFFMPFSQKSPTGFHIHFGNLSDEEITERGEETSLIQNLDKYLVLPTLQLNKEAINARKKRGYGELGDYRESEVAEGLEYRTLPSIVLATPEITEAIFNVAIKIFDLWWQGKLPKISPAEQRKISEIYESNSFYASELLTQKIRKQLLKLAPETKESINFFYNKKIRKVKDLRETWDIKIELTLPNAKELLAKTREMIDSFNAISVGNEVYNAIRGDGSGGFLINDISVGIQKLFTLLNYIPSKYRYRLVGSKKDRGNNFLTDITDQNQECYLYVPYNLRTKLSNEKMIYEIGKAILGIDSGKEMFGKIKKEKPTSGSLIYADWQINAVRRNENGDDLNDDETTFVRDTSQTNYQYIVNHLI